MVALMCVMILSSVVLCLMELPPLVSRRPTEIVAVTLVATRVMFVANTFLVSVLTL